MMETRQLHQVRRSSPRWPPAEEEEAARGGGRGGSGATTFTSATATACQRRSPQEHMTNGEGALLWQNPHTRDHLDKHKKNKSVDARESNEHR
jgi:hypothetical protein